MAVKIKGYELASANQLKSQAANGNRSRNSIFIEVLHGESMTYCVGWLTKNAVYMFADTAVTSTASLATPVSSFGEMHGPLNARSDLQLVVEEKGLKIFNIKDQCAASLTGDVGAGEILLAQIIDQLNLGEDLIDALNRVFYSNGPYLSGREVVLLFAAYKDGKPSLVSLDTTQGINIAEEDTVFQTGSLNMDYRNNTAAIASGLTGFVAENDNDETRKKAFLAMLSKLQSYGIYDYLIGKEVGGAFTGLWISSSGMHWQPDIFYILYNPHDISKELTSAYISIKEDILCIVSQGKNKFIANGLFQVTTGKNARSAVIAAVAETYSKYDSALFEYVIFISKAEPIITIIEMNRNRSHAYVLLSVEEESLHTVGIYLLDPLLDTLAECISKHDHRIRFIAYQPLPMHPNDVDNMKKSAMRDQVLSLLPD